MQPHAGRAAWNWIRKSAWSCKVGGAYRSPRRSLHSTVPNTSRVTRYSIDFRTVHLDDVMAGSARATSIPPAPERQWAITSGHRLSHIPAEAWRYTSTALRVAEYATAMKTRPEFVERTNGHEA